MISSRPAASVVVPNPSLLEHAPLRIRLVSEEEVRADLFRLAGCFFRGRK